MPEWILDLNGSDWLLKDYEHEKGAAKKPFAAATSTKDWMATDVPGDIHPTLVREGRIPDPYFGMNIEECKWTPRREWWFRKEFEVKKSFLKSKMELVFDGIDTYGTVWLNGVEVGRTENMFTSYTFDVTKAVKPGKNLLTVRIGATIPIIEAFPHQEYFACFYTPRIFARKAQCQFSWDWAPHLPALGIWRGVRLVASEPGRIVDSVVRPRNTGEVRVYVELDQKTTRQDLDQSVSDKGEHNAWRPRGTLTYEIKAPDGTKTRKTEKVRGGKNFTVLHVEKPQLWWPNGHGEQPLYEYTITLRQDGKVAHVRKGRFGFREVELIEPDQGENGVGFRFLINGRPVFCKGANWIPADCFTGTVRRERYDYLLTLVRDANFNMLRVWGGGIYEQDDFYDRCDELGIMVWQDFMFACSDYPDNFDWFVNLVIPETTYQIKRLREHPSLVYWCGGNEKTGSAGFNIHYGEKIFDIVNRGLVADLDPTRAYRAASPHSYTDLGNDPDSGDTHGSCYEKALHHGVPKFRSFIDQIRTTFNSEFGLHGPARYRSLVKFVPEDNLWPPNEILEYHVQDNPYNSLDETFVWNQIQMAKELFGEFDDIRTFIKYGSAGHAEIMRAEFEHHRRRKWINSGAMLWMFNDCWPCASWSIVDYYGLPKPVYYMAARACAPVITSLHRSGDAYTVHVINDLAKSLDGVLTFGQQAVDGRVLWKQSRKFKAGENGAAAAAEFAASKVKSDANTYLFAIYEYRGGEARNAFFPDLWRDIEWPDPELVVKFGEPVKDGKEWTVKAIVHTRRYARFVSLSTETDLPEVRYSDNFFDLLPGEKRSVTIRSKKRLAPSSFRVDHWLTEWD